MKGKFKQTVVRYTQRMGWDEDSDLEMRKSPKPTIETQIDSRDHIIKDYTANDHISKGTTNPVPTHKFYSPSQSHIAIPQNHPQGREQMRHLWDTWKEFRPSAKVMETVDFLMKHVECCEEDLVLLVYLKEVAQIRHLRFKMMNANLNISLLEMTEEDAKKLLLLKILVEKHNKKLFFSQAARQKYLGMLRKIEASTKSTRERKQQTERISSILGRIVAGRVSEVIRRILEENTRKSLDGQQSQSLKRLLLDQSSQLSPQQHHHDGDSVEYYEKPAEEHFSGSGLKESTEGVEYSPQDFVVTIRRLESEGQSVRSKFMKLEEKLKKLHFISWKVAFLYRHLESVLEKRNNDRLLKGCFEAFRTEESVTRETQNDIEDEQSSRQSKLDWQLMMRRSSIALRKLKQNSDTAKILEFVEVIYNRRLLRKALVGLSLFHSAQLLQQPLAPTSQAGSPPKQYPQVFVRDNQDNHRRLSWEASKNDEPEELSREEEIQVGFFRRAHLQTKCYFVLKNCYTLSKLSKAVSRLVTRLTFNLVLSYSETVGNRIQKVGRHQETRNKLLLFRCFRALKGQVPRNQDVEVYVNCKSKFLLQNVFSVLKLGWKQMLIKAKKAAMVRSYMQTKSCFQTFKQVLTPNMELNTKFGRLLKARRYRKGKKVMKEIIRNSIVIKTKKGRILQIESSMSNIHSEKKLTSTSPEMRPYATHKSYSSILEEYKAMRQLNMKTKVFWLWMRMALLHKKELITSMQDTVTTSNHNPDFDSFSLQSSSKSQTSKSNFQLTSQDHRYWLEVYYEQMCAFDH